MFGNESAIKTLMECGADYKSTNNEGKKPNEVAETPQISDLIIKLHKQ